jgi:hypothetical protein
VAHRQDITVPLQEYLAQAAPDSQDRTTLPLADTGAPPRPSLPFRAPIAPALSEALPRAAQETVLHEMPQVCTPRHRGGTCLAVVITAFLLCHAVLFAIVAWRRAPAPAPDAAIVASVTAVWSPSEATLTASPPAGPAGVTAAAPIVSAPRMIQPRVVRSPAPARTARHGTSDVREPWGF